MIKFLYSFTYVYWVNNNSVNILDIFHEIKFYIFKGFHNKALNFK